MPSTTKSHSAAALGGHNGGDPSALVALENLDAFVEPHGDTVFTVDAFDHVTEIWAEDPEQSGLEWLDNGDILSELSEGSGNFGADETHPAMATR